MTVNIIQTTVKTLSEDREVLKTSVTEAYVLIPDAGKALKNIHTGKIYTYYVNLGSKKNVADYIEIDL